MHVSIHARSGALTPPERALTTHCPTVCASLGLEGAPTPVRRWEPTTEEDVALDAHARHLIRLRARGRRPRS